VRIHQGRKQPMSTDKKTIKEIDQEVQRCIDNYTLSRNTHLLSHIFKRYGIAQYLELFDRWDDNLYLYKDRVVQSYHNKSHCISVALNCYEGVMNSAHLKTDDRISLLLAGLFHDYQHTRGGNPRQQCHSDSVNIQNALYGLDDVHKDVTSKVNAEIYKKTRHLITSTQHIQKGTQTKNPNETVKIIRDANNMVLYDMFDIVINQLTGLFNEKCIENDLLFNREISLNEFIEANKERLQKIKWNTQWARLKAFKHNHPARIKLAFDLLLKQSKEENQVSPVQW